jgi:hypothetical protein
MIRYVFALLLLVGLSLAPSSALAQAGIVTCDRWSFTNIQGAAGPVEFVSAVPGQRIYICGYALTTSGNALDFQLWSGTGTNCAGNKIPMTPQISMGQNSSFVNRSPYIAETTEVGYALCAQVFGASTIKLVITVYWRQF